MELKDCFYFVEAGFIRPMCVECYKKLRQENKLPEEIWFWKGSLLGYGQWNITCACGETIYKYEENQTVIQNP